MIFTRDEWFSALEKRHGRDLQQKLLSSSVAVCGLGGLGSAVAVSLARMGIGKLIIIDHDRVDITNLHRQQYRADQVGKYKTEAMAENLRAISPYIDLHADTAFISEHNIAFLLKDADIICEAFDAAENKAMLVNFVLQMMPDKYIVSASGMAGIGSANDIKTRKVTERFYLCGDEISGVDSDTSLFSSRVMICAAHQAHMILRIIANKDSKIKC